MDHQLELKNCVDCHVYYDPFMILIMLKLGYIEVFFFFIIKSEVRSLYIETSISADPIILLSQFVCFDPFYPIRLVTYTVCVLCSQGLNSKLRGSFIENKKIWLHFDHLLMQQNSQFTELKNVFNFPLNVA